MYFAQIFFIIKNGVKQFILRFENSRQFLLKMGYEEKFLFCFGVTTFSEDVEQMDGLLNYRW